MLIDEVARVRIDTLERQLADAVRRLDTRIDSLGEVMQARDTRVVELGARMNVRDVKRAELWQRLHSVEQKLLAAAWLALETPDVVQPKVDERGWSAESVRKCGAFPSEARRHGFKWNDKESDDLWRDAVGFGKPKFDLKRAAQLHERSEQSIKDQTRRLFAERVGFSSGGF